MQLHTSTPTPTPNHVPHGYVLSPAITEAIEAAKKATEAASVAMAAATHAEAIVAAAVAAEMAAHATVTQEEAQQEASTPEFQQCEEQMADSIGHAIENTTSLVVNQPNIRKKRMTTETRTQIAHIMMLNYTNNKIKYGVLTRLSQEFNVSRITINNYWLTVKEQIRRGETVAVARRYKGSKKRVIIDLEQVRSIPLYKRTSVRSLACAMNLNPSTVHRLVKQGKIRSHSNAIKPLLTEKNMIERMQWVLNHVNRVSLNGRLRFEDMFDVVHMDEKWYYMTRLSQKYYLLPDEQEPHRTCKSKRFITKIMFMGAVARPRISRDGEVSFDGKIGIFPFSCVVPAKRSSKNRDKGTLETRPIERITKAVIKTCMIEKVIPAIKAKWSDTRGKKIFIQQDNARPHISPNDPDFRAAATADGWDIELICQPPNSPDLNILDLGLFNTIQTLQHEKAPKSVVELVNAVVRSYEEVTPVILNYTWLSLQTCMNEILIKKGNNNYKIPHMGKKRLDRLKQLPTTVEPEEESMADALTLVNQYHLSQMIS